MTKPTFIDSQGGRHYYQRLHGCYRYHRTAGPAYNGPTGVVYYIDNTRLTFDEWCATTNKSESEKTMLRLKYPKQLVIGAHDMRGVGTSRRHG